jgi:predicted transposase YbfD/YdcC
MEKFDKVRQDWFSQFQELPDGIPSHDTLNRVFSLLSPVAFRECFIIWIQDVAEILPGQVIPIDGKTVRRSHDRKSGKAAVHMVSARATETELVLVQVKTDKKLNEIATVPELLDLLDVKRLRDKH